MKIQLGMWTIRTAASLKKKIVEANEGFDASRPEKWQYDLLNRLIGVYDTRIFGLVFYRNGNYPELHPEKATKFVYRR